tara:strand:+ start:2590 stop:2736 length:147 start_codon:yes stop_codon:yes gene_type:complete
VLGGAAQSVSSPLRRTGGFRMHRIDAGHFNFNPEPIFENGIRRTAVAS